MGSKHNKKTCNLICSLHPPPHRHLRSKVRGPRSEVQGARSKKGRWALEGFAIYSCMWVCIYVGMYVYMYDFLYVCMYVHIYVCMILFVRMYSCRCVSQRCTISTQISFIECGLCFWSLPSKRTLISAAKPLHIRDHTHRFYERLSYLCTWSHLWLFNAYRQYEQLPLCLGFG